MPGELVAAQFACNGSQVEVDVFPGTSLLEVLREHLGITSAKDGCAPQGQCGCCTVLVDGDARVACVTPIERVSGRSVTTVEGLSEAERAAFGAAFCETGASQCGFCTPGIVMRGAALARAGRLTRVDLDKALAAHLCRCTGWLSIYEAIGLAAERLRADSATESARKSGTESADSATESARSQRVGAAHRAFLEGGVAQRVDTEVPLGEGGFADDAAPRDALVALPLPPGRANDGAVEAAGMRWVIGASLGEARRLTGKVQGRRATHDPGPPIEAPPLPEGVVGVRLQTSWMEPAYLEPDASWCPPGVTPATPLANGGAFGGKSESRAPQAARELADRLGHPVRVLYSREDVVRLGPKRPPIGAAAWIDTTPEHPAGVVRLHLRIPTGTSVAFAGPGDGGHGGDGGGQSIVIEEVAIAGPPTSARMRGFGWVERAVLGEAAWAEAGVARPDLPIQAPSGARAGAEVMLDGLTGRLESVVVRVSAGDPLDSVVLRSYVLGAVHQALGWVLTERIGVDPLTGEVHDLTIRSFAILRARHMPRVHIEIVDGDGPPRAQSSDAVFAAVAAACWNALAVAEDVRPATFPASGTRAALALRR